MANIIAFVPRTSPAAAPPCGGSFGEGSIIAFKRTKALAPADNELAALNRATIALMEADRRDDATEAAEWRDELDVLSIYTQDEVHRARCNAAIRASLEKAARRLQ
ncbi:hypothetical protein C8J36_104140 [Rhizobium sp. PP-F2F-G48]|uniref:hypothetical protein n=1 Tax=Rhizobium sp. PP-F2F-G48 TaxID=2135651 RepID=UPI0010496D51|nr:hypothetical protein [Rhizobium sp. PP-F2F-G48]TCM54948.1 hypothetical protein C8J36_104140 [Rhizobium sp. PP-F2F-G48]